MLRSSSPNSLPPSIHLVRPFYGGGRRELVRRPKAYGFDTGLVTFVRGWQEIRDDDRGLLWEHLVLDVLRASVGSEGVFYWRDKSGRESAKRVRQSEPQAAGDRSPLHFSRILTGLKGTGCQS
jgi:hypothetical protein